LLDSLLQENLFHLDLLGRVVKMKQLVLLCLLGLTFTNALELEEIFRVKRDDCLKVHNDFNACTKEAYRTYTAAIAAGDDGREHWRARKSCNYMTDSIENCGQKLVEGGCMSEEAVNKMKDDQLKKILTNLQVTVADWDSDKCPPIKDHIERMKAAEAEQVAPAAETAKVQAEDPAPEPETEPEPEPETEPEPEPQTDGAPSVTMFSCLVILLFSRLL